MTLPQGGCYHRACQISNRQLSPARGLERDPATPLNNAGERLYWLIRGSGAALTLTRPASRAVTHVAVIGLVAFASAFGFAATRPATSADLDSASLLPFDLVARVRGADSAAFSARTSTFELHPDPNRPDPMLQRRVVRRSAERPADAGRAAAARAGPAGRGFVGSVAVAPPPPVIPQHVVGTGVLGWPVNGTITTYFSSWHLAIDIAAPVRHAP